MKEEIAGPDTDNCNFRHATPSNYTQEVLCILSALLQTTIY